MAMHLFLNSVLKKRVIEVNKVVLFQAALFVRMSNIKEWSNENLTLYLKTCKMHKSMTIVF